MSMSNIQFMLLCFIFCVFSQASLLALVAPTRPTSWSAARPQSLILMLDIQLIFTVYKVFASASLKLQT